MKKKEHVPQTLRIAHVDQDVLTLALERIEETYRRYDRVSVGFSGGKDSTVVLQLAIEVATRLGRLPVDAFFWDEEAIYPKTVEYVERVRTRGDVALRWLCVPHEHRNACSRTEPNWYPWDPTKEKLWVRQPHPLSERSLPGLVKPVPIPEAPRFLFDPADGTVGVLTGIRTQESLRRLRAVTRKVTDNWISKDGSCDHVFQCKPIYDWKLEDVWTYALRSGCDYNRAYDDFEMMGMPRHVQRVCPPFGEEPLQNLHAYSVLAPETWERMIDRVHGARTAARYSQSPLYGVGSSGQGAEDPQQAILSALELWPPEIREQIKYRIKKEIDSWNRHTNNAPIPAKAKAGFFSWEFLIRIAKRGDLKGRKTADKIEQT